MGLPKHNVTRIATSAAVKATAAHVYGIQLIGGSAAATLKLTNDANGSGTGVVEAAAPIGATVFIDFTDLGPVAFSTALYATIAGTGAIAYIWWD